MHQAPTFDTRQQARNNVASLEWQDNLNEFIVKDYKVRLRLDSCSHLVALCAKIGVSRSRLASAENRKPVQDRHVVC